MPLALAIVVGAVAVADAVTVAIPAKTSSPLPSPVADEQSNIPNNARRVNHERMRYVPAELRAVLHTRSIGHN